MRLDALSARCWLVNATARSELVVLAGAALGRRVIVRDCQGAVVSDAGLDLNGAQRIAVPPSGLVLLEG